MPIDERRRDEIAAAVAAYDHANPLTPLPRNAARLLAVMFPTEDVCRRSLQALAGEGRFDRGQFSTQIGPTDEPFADEVWQVQFLVRDVELKAQIFRVDPADMYVGDVAHDADGKGGVEPRFRPAT